EQLRHLPTPHLFRAHDASDKTKGQRVAEIAASRIGSWPFLIGQSVVLAAWSIFNSVAVFPHFDNSPDISLNRMLSFQAAFTGPVLLIAANVGAMRDHKQYDRMEQMETSIIDELTATRNELAEARVENAELRQMIAVVCEHFALELTHAS